MDELFPSDKSSNRTEKWIERHFIEGQHLFDITPEFDSYKSINQKELEIEARHSAKNKNDKQINSKVILQGDQEASSIISMHKQLSLANPPHESSSKNIPIKNLIKKKGCNNSENNTNYKNVFKNNENISRGELLVLPTNKNQKQPNSIAFTTFFNGSDNSYYNSFMPLPLISPIQKCTSYSNSPSMVNNNYMHYLWYKQVQFQMQMFNSMFNSRNMFPLELPECKPKNSYNCNLTWCTINNVQPSFVLSEKSDQSNDEFLNYFKNYSSYSFWNPKRKCCSIKDFFDENVARNQKAPNKHESQNNKRTATASRERHHSLYSTTSTEEYTPPHPVKKIKTTTYNKLSLPLNSDNLQQQTPISTILSRQELNPKFLPVSGGAQAKNPNLPKTAPLPPKRHNSQGNSPTHGFAVSLTNFRHRPPTLNKSQQDENSKLTYINCLQNEHGNSLFRHPPQSMNNASEKSASLQNLTDMTMMLPGCGSESRHQHHHMPKTNIPKGHSNNTSSRENHESHQEMEHSGRAMVEDGSRPSSANVMNGSQPLALGAASYNNAYASYMTSMSAAMQAYMAGMYGASPTVTNNGMMNNASPFPFHFLPPSAYPPPPTPLRMQAPFATSVFNNKNTTNPAVNRQPGGSKMPSSQKRVTPTKSTPSKSCHAAGGGNRSTPVTPNLTPPRIDHHSAAGNDTGFNCNNNGPAFNAQQAAAAAAYYKSLFHSYPFLLPHQPHLNAASSAPTPTFFPSLFAMFQPPGISPFAPTPMIPPHFGSHYPYLPSQLHPSTAMSCPSIPNPFTPLPPACCIPNTALTSIMTKLPGGKRANNNTEPKPGPLEAGQASSSMTSMNNFAKLHARLNKEFLEAHGSDPNNTVNTHHPTPNGALLLPGSIPPPTPPPLFPSPKATSNLTSGTYPINHPYYMMAMESHYNNQARSANAVGAPLSSDQQHPAFAYYRQYLAAAAFIAAAQQQQQQQFSSNGGPSLPVPTYPYGGHPFYTLPPSIKFPNPASVKSSSPLPHPSGSDSNLRQATTLLNASSTKDAQHPHISPSPHFDKSLKLHLADENKDAVNSNKRLAQNPKSGNTPRLSPRDYQGEIDNIGTTDQGFHNNNQQPQQIELAQILKNVKNQQNSPVISSLMTSTFSSSKTPVGGSCSKQTDQPSIPRFSITSAAPTPTGSFILASRNEKFTCQTCGKIFGKQSQLTLHMNVHYFEKPFRCEHCSLAFRNKATFNKHKCSATLPKRSAHLSTAHGGSTSRGNNNVSASFLATFGGGLNAAKSSISQLIKASSSTNSGVLPCHNSGSLVNGHNLLINDDSTDNKRSGETSGNIDNNNNYPLSYIRDMTGEQSAPHNLPSSATLSENFDNNDPNKSPTTSKTAHDPRPFKCDDCQVAFRIQGHLAKHLRSKMHITGLEKNGKVPCGTYAFFDQRASLNDIDTSSCAASLGSLHKLLQQNVVPPSNEADANELPDQNVPTLPDKLTQNHLKSDTVSPVINVSTTNLIDHRHHLYEHTESYGSPKITSVKADHPNNGAESAHMRTAFNNAVSTLITAATNHGFLSNYYYPINDLSHSPPPSLHPIQSVKEDEETTSQNARADDYCYFSSLAQPPPKKRNLHKLLSSDASASNMDDQNNGSEVHHDDNGFNNDDSRGSPPYIKDINHNHHSCSGSPPPPSDFVHNQKSSTDDSPNNSSSRGKYLANALNFNLNPADRAQQPANIMDIGTLSNNNTNSNNTESSSPPPTAGLVFSNLDVLCSASNYCKKINAS